MAYLSVLRWSHALEPVSAGTDGGPRSRVYARLTLQAAPSDNSEKISGAYVLGVGEVDFINISELSFFSQQKPKQNL